MGKTVYCNVLYTLGHKKRATLLLSISSPIIDRFFKILSLAHSADNLQYCDYYTSHHTINVSLHYLVKYKCKQKLTIIKIYINEKMLQTNIAMNVRMTLDCVIPTQSSVIQTIHCNVGLKCFFFNFTKMFVIIDV